LNQNKVSENSSQKIIFVNAGGDGSLVNNLMKAKEHGVDINRLVCCPLPYGTSNDLSRITGWGAEPDGPLYESNRTLITEMIANSQERKISIWTIIVKFKEGGDTLEINPRSKSYISKNQTFFERYMVNYWGLGEDARVGVGKLSISKPIEFEKHRTTKRGCNNCIYCWVGCVNFICTCRRPPSVFQHIEYLKTKKNEDV
jgi:diacylglycerol kinase (ATP)